MGNCNARDVSSVSVESVASPLTSSQQVAVEAEESELYAKLLWLNLMTKQEIVDKFGSDQTLPSTANIRYIELRALLEESCTYNILYAACDSPFKRKMMNCWYEMWTLKHYEQRSSLYYIKCKTVYLKYRKHYAACGNSESIFKHGYLPPKALEICDGYFEPEQCDACTTSNGQKHSHVLIPLMHLCFFNIFESIFLPFIKTQSYSDLTEHLRTVVNQVHANDFQYSGGIYHSNYGLVVDCIKRSTNMKYIMKVFLVFL